MQARSREAGKGASLSGLYPWHHHDHTTQALPSAQQICTPHSLPQPDGWELTFSSYTKRADFLWMSSRGWRSPIPGLCSIITI